MTSDNNTNPDLKPKKKKKKKNRCEFIVDTKTNKKCGKKLQMFFDKECKYCKKYYCIHHRLLEDHKCPNLDDWRKEKKDILNKTLIEGKATFQKVIKI